MHLPQRLPVRRLIALALSACALAGFSVSLASAQTKYPIKHVVIIMQENRSFDNYFGTYPGADGIPTGICVPLDPANPPNGCVLPFHDPNDVGSGGPHRDVDAKVDIDDGITTVKEDGYVLSQINAPTKCTDPNNPNCAPSHDGVLRHDVMGYHDGSDIPNYWAYAANFVLQDRLFAGVRAWSLPSHLDLASEWVAACTDNSDASTCRTAPTLLKPTSTTQYPWASLFQLLDTYNVSWKYYLGTGLEPDCEDDEMTCDPQLQTASVPSIWNTAPYFQYVKQQGAGYLALHDVDSKRFLADIAAGQLPQVSWIVPSSVYSEHPPSGITAGMEYVTSLINAVMQSRYWQNTAIFVAWDDWGGFYDHVEPPNVDASQYKNTPVQGFGIRVPGLMISAFARPGYIDHSLYSFDSYATFFEDLFAGGARLDPAKLGNPDHRPDIRDALTEVSFLYGRTERIGNFMDEFDFAQPPRPPLLLSTHIPTGIAAKCAENTIGKCTSSTVTLSWEALTGPEVPGPFTYHILRDGTGLPQCTGIATTCTDTPGSGSHLYRAYSVDQNGVISPNSAAASVSEP